MPDSPSSNGALVRFVGRKRIQDGHLINGITCVKAVLTPLLLRDLVSARRARDSWAECVFQLFSLGSVPRSLQPPAPYASTDSVRFVLISDTHNRHTKLPELPAGDVLVHCGDFTNHGSLGEVHQFAKWMAEQPHKTKIVVPGNHDMILDGAYYEEYWGDWSYNKESHDEALAEFKNRGILLLVDSSIELLGLKIHGSPWISRETPWKTGFNKEPEEMEGTWQSLPSDVDVLLTHMPPHGVGDREPSGHHIGCPHLARRVEDIAPQLHAFGHVHSDYGAFRGTSSLAVDSIQVHENVGVQTSSSACMTSGAMSARKNTVFVNAACVSDGYRVGGRRAIVIDVPVKLSSAM